MKKNKQVIKGNNNILIGGDIIFNEDTIDKSELTDQQIKNRWYDIKKEIKRRPLLAYRIGISLDKWNDYSHNIPEKEEVNAMYNKIKEDRKNKTDRIKNKLSEIVGYREANIYAKRMGISPTSIKNILEDKSSKLPSYEMIDRIEIFINAIDDAFDVSLENTISFKEYIRDLIEKEVKSINNIANYLNSKGYELFDMLSSVKTDICGNETLPTSFLETSINNLKESKEKLDIIYETYKNKR